MKESSKYYTGLEQEYVNSLSWWQDEAKDRNEPVEVELQKRAIGSGEMWCRIEGEYIESGSNDCGKGCPDYRPRNGKSGCCRSLTNTFEGTGIFFIVYPDGKITHRRPG